VLVLYEKADAAGKYRGRPCLNEVIEASGVLSRSSGISGLSDFGGDSYVQTVTTSCVRSIATQT